jgi:hypothetical protein
MKIPFVRKYGILLYIGWTLKKRCDITGRMAFVIAEQATVKTYRYLLSVPASFILNNIKSKDMPGTRKRSGMRFIVLSLIFLLVVGYTNYTVYKKFIRTDAYYRQPPCDALFMYDLKTR